MIHTFNLMNISMVSSSFMNWIGSLQGIFGWLMYSI